MPKQTIFDRKNVLVTGGAGFIGSFLCDELVQHAKVICVDNFVSSTPENIHHLLRHPNFILLRHDLRTPLRFEDYPELARFEIGLQGIQEIYHLACPSSPRVFAHLKIETLDANSIVMKHVLELAVATKAKFVHASSSVVYGGRPSDAALFTEHYIGSIDAHSPRACYDEGKQFAETMVVTYRDVHGLDAKIARIFRTYGPRMRLSDGQMIPDFILSALEGKELVVYGTEDTSASFIYVTDVVSALLRLMDAHGGIGAVNIGSDRDVRLAEIAEKIIAMTTSSSRVTFHDPLPFTSPTGLPDLRKAREQLAWIPVVTLDEGLQKTIEYTTAQKSLVT